MVTVGGPGYLCLATVTVAVAVPLVYFFLRDAPSGQGKAAPPDKDAAATGNSEKTTLNLLPVLKTRLLWQLFLIFSFLSFGLYGVLSHMVPMMTDRGMTTGDAALVQSTLGIAIVVSRIFVGYLIDLFSATKVAFYLLFDQRLRCGHPGSRRSRHAGVSGRSVHRAEHGRGDRHAGVSYQPLLRSG